MTALVLTSWDGQLHAHVDHVEAKSSEPVLGDEVDCIPLPSAEGHLPIAKLRILYPGYFARAELRVAA
jgi:hypothetical protein